MANYLYGPNKIPLPALPEWDKAIYPYALIEHYDFDDGTTGNFLYVFSTPFVTVDLTEQYGYVSVQVEDGGKYMYWAYYPDRETEWRGANIPITSDSWETRTTKIAWANTDIYNPDGTLYLAASDPIPITAPALDPLSLFMGWKAGNWVARQRGKAKPATGVYDDTMPIEWKMQDVANNFRIPAKTFQIYSYNGLEFGRPDIEADSAYKYHLIEKYSSGYHYWCLKQPFVYINEDKEYAKIEGGYNYSLYICKTGEIGFAYHDDISGDDLKLNWEDIIWTNTNICDADGTVRMAATEPVYIREQVKDWLVKISNYIPSLEIFEKSAVSISYGGEEAIFTYIFLDNSYTGFTIVLFMDVTTYTNFVMFAIKKDNEVIPGEPGLYLLTDESIPSDVTFKFFVPDET